MVAWILGIISVALILAGDYFLKLSAINGGVFSYTTLLAAILYAGSAPLWALIMQERTLTEVSVMFTALVLFGLPLIGMVWFGELPEVKQSIGLLLMLAAVILIEI